MDPLFEAIWNKDSNRALALIDDGADVNLTDHDGNTPLFYSCMYKMPEVALALINKTSDLDGQYSIESPLTLACKNEMAEVALALIANGADVDSKDRDGNTPLIYSCKYEMTDVALALIANDAWPNYINSDGDTALIFACQNKMLEVALALLASDVNVNIINDDGESALVWAYLNRMPSLVTALRGKGAVYEPDSRLDEVIQQTIKSYRHPTLGNYHFWPESNKDTIATLARLRSLTNTVVTLLPNELLEEISKHL